MTSSWTTSASSYSGGLSNPILGSLGKLQFESKPKKTPIDLGMGDPTRYGGLFAENPSYVNEAISMCAVNRTSTGYQPGAGIPSSRAAIAESMSKGDAKYDQSSVFITVGACQALEFAIAVLCDVGDNVLVSSPRFTQYDVLCKAHGVDINKYKLDPEKEWEIDLTDLEASVNDRTKAILVNNPSNPCGCVYPRKHLEDILALAEKLHLPIIADEIYGDLVFPGEEFVSLASVSASVPVLTASGMSKTFMVPGWRCGWLALHDPMDRSQGKIKQGLVNLSNLVLGAASLVQSVIPTAIKGLAETDILHRLCQGLKERADVITSGLASAPGVKVIPARGTFCIMLQIFPDEFDDSITDDWTFTQLLLAEECVKVVPASVLDCKNFVRLITCPPPETLQDCCDRIILFCNRHKK